MKTKCLLVLVACLLFSGCGDIDWFPETTTTTNPSTNPTDNTNTTSSPILTREFAPLAILAGKTTSTLTFTITNAKDNPAQTGLEFDVALDPSLKVTAGASTCGGEFSVTSSKTIILTNGALTAGTSKCTMTATVDGTTAGTFPNPATDVKDLHGGLVSNVTDQTLKVFASSVSDVAGTITASDLQFPSTDSATLRTYSLTVSVKNNTATRVNNATVEVIPVDANGDEVKDNALPLSQIIQDPVDANATVRIPAAPIPVEVPLATAQTIKFWRITNVLAQ